MQEFRTLIIGISALVLVFSAVDLLLPEGGTRGYARFVCGLVLMLMLLKPLSGLLSWEPEKSQALAVEAAQQAEMALAVDNRLINEQVHRAAGAFGAQVEAVVYANDTGGIGRIELVVLDGDAQLAKDGVCAAFGLLPEDVIVRERRE